MSIESKTTHEGASNKLLLELSPPIHENVENVSQNTQEIIDENGFFYAIVFLKNIFDSNEEMTESDREKIDGYFSQVSFLNKLNLYLQAELNEIYLYGNIDTFSKVSFVGFLLGKGKNPAAYAFSDIHKIDKELVRNMFFSYESEIPEYARTGKKELEQACIQIYIKFLNFIGILAMLNEMDHDRRTLIFLLTSQINETIQKIKRSSFIEFDQKTSHTNTSSPTFGETLEYIQARTFINSQHLQYIESNNIETTFTDFSNIFNDMYKSFATASRVNFLGEEGKKQTLTSAFIGNTTIFMFALIHRMEKEKSINFDTLFNHPLFLDEIMQPYILQMNNAFRLLNGPAQTIHPNIQNLAQFKIFCTQVITHNYNMTFGTPSSHFTSFENIIEDVVSVLNNLDDKAQIDYRMDLCYYILSNTDYVSGDLLGRLADSLVSSEKSNSYHTEAVKLKLMDTIIKKITQSTFSSDFLQNFLEQVENYISKNKKNSIILNVYARLYLTLSFAYSKISSQKEKSLSLYFMYEELNTSKVLEKFYGIESSLILNNLFPGDPVENITNHSYYINQHEKFVEKKWHSTQKKINHISLTNRIEAYSEALEVLSNEFFYGIVDIYVINKEVDSIPKVRKGNSFQEFPISLESDSGVVAHTLIFHYPNNYKENFNKILGESGKVEHIASQVQDIFKKLGLYILPIKKKIQNAILEALENGEKRCVPYFQPIVGVSGEVGSYECLMRILGKDGNPLLIQDEETGEFYAIDRQLEIASHLGLTTRITQKLLSDVFDIAQKNPQFEFNINLSYDDIMNDVIFQRLKDLALQYPGVVSHIVIELLENKIHDLSYFDKVKELSDIGYKIAVDDFGSEYNNISILSQLHKYDIKLHKLKIDQVVIQDIIFPLIPDEYYKYQTEMNNIQLSQEERDAAKKKLEFNEIIINEIQIPLIDQELDLLNKEFRNKVIGRRVAIKNIKHFIDLAMTYPIEGGVVAEYVDNKSVFCKLKELGVKSFQGYLIGKPNSTLEIKK